MTFVVSNYTGTGTPAVNTPQESAGIDWTNDRGYFLDCHNSTGYLYQFTLETPATPTASLDVSGLSFVTSLNCFTSGQDGNCYLYKTDGTLYKFACGAGSIGAPSALANTFGVSMGKQLTTIKAGSDTFALMCSIFGVDTTGGPSHLYGLVFFLYNCTTGTQVSGTGVANVPGAIGNGVTEPDNGLFNSGPCRFIRGGSAGGVGTAYIIESSPAAFTSLQIDTVTVQDSGTYTFNNTGSISAAAIDAGWTAIGVTGGVVDQADGNIVVGLLGQGGATNPAYIVKVKPNGTILWKTPVNGGIVFSDNSVCNGSMTVMSSVSPGGGYFRVYTFNTSTGAVGYVDQNVSGLLNQDQYFSSAVGQMIFFQSFEHFAWATFGQSTPSGPFVNTLPGDVVQVGCVQVLVTAVLSGKQITGTVVNGPLPILANDPDNTPLPIPAGSWQLTRPVSAIGGLAYLEGKLVTGIADGLVITPRRVSGGSINLDNPATLVIIGLGYVSQLQTMRIDLGDIQGGTVQGKRKMIPAVTVRLDCSLGMSIGPDFDHLVPMKEVAVPFSIPGVLVTDDIRTVIPAHWKVDGQIAIQQTLPLPMGVLGVIPEVVIGDTRR